MNKNIGIIIIGLAVGCFPAKAQENHSSTPTASQADTTAVASKPEKKVHITGLPIISFDRSKGTGFGGMGMAFFKFGNRPDTKPSSVMLSGKVTTQKNWHASAMASLYFSGDRFRLMTGAGYMNSNFQTYEMIDQANVEVPYNNHGGFFVVMPSMRVWNRLYVGFGGQMFKSHLDMDMPDPQTDSISVSWMNSLAASVQFDQRDSPYNPAGGINTSLRFNYFPDWMKNVDTYYKMHAEFNIYNRLSPSMVLASRAALNVGLGGLPFQGQNYIGNRDIRGYTKGAYRGDQTYAVQSELRWNFYHRWGAVGFFGLALATTPKDNYVSPLLPGGGAGLRYMILPVYNINLGIDAALGRDDWGVYFRIAEAF